MDLPRRHVAVAGLAAGLLTAAAVAGGPGEGPSRLATPSGTTLTVETLVGGLDTVWDMIWAPDGSLWLTERPGRVSRVDVRTGSLTVLAEIDVVERSESGLMGIALHPDFPERPWVYLVHSYGADGGIRNRLVRMTYENGRLGRLQPLLEGMPGRGNHNGSRIVFGPDRLLYLTMGEAGDRPLSQDRRSLGGKILRLTEDGAPAPGNPFGSEVWSWGHRNPQGLVFRPGTDELYSSEHGPRTDDELNRIEPGGNYGWPSVAGFCDDTDERVFCGANRVVEPLHSWTPTVGIAGADFVPAGAGTDWDGDLLVVALRGESLFRAVLSADGRAVRSVERLFQGEYGRLRDVLVGTEGTVYIGTSNQDGRGRPRSNDDRILMFTPE